MFFGTILICTREMQFWQPRYIFKEKCRFLLLNVQIWIKTNKLLKKQIPVKKISPWTPRKQFRQPGWYFFAKTLKPFRSRSEKDEKSSQFFQRIIHLENVPTGT